MVAERSCEAGEAGEVLAEAFAHIRADALLLAIAGSDDFALEFLEALDVRDPCLRALAAALDGSPSNRDKAEEDKARGGLPDLHPTGKVGVARLPVGPPPDDSADEHDEDGGVAVQEPDGEENGTGVKEEEADLVTGDVINKTDDEHAEESECEERTPGSRPAVLRERHGG